MASFPDAYVVGFVGAGNMAGALVRGLVKGSIVPPQRIWVSSPSGPSTSLQELGIHCTKSNADVATHADVLIIAVKPFMMREAVASFAGALRPHTLIVSIAAGIKMASVQEQLRPDVAWKLLRVMPNTPAAIGVGASAMCAGAGVAKEEVDLVARLFTAVGTIHTVKESQLDAVTGLSGSGPAYVFMFIEALADGGVASGLPRPVALALATQLVKGAATLVQETGTHPGQLKDNVASPGGTTIAGIHALESGAFRGTVMSAVVAASKRSEELGR